MNFLIFSEILNTSFVSELIKKNLSCGNLGFPLPEGISSSLGDFIVLVFNIEVFQIKFS